MKQIPTEVASPDSAARSTEPHEPEACGQVRTKKGRYRLRFASSSADRTAVFRLRFVVFNLELKEGLETAYTTGLDMDRFDKFCDHLIVEDSETCTVVGTYRLQPGSRAIAADGFYSEREFDFAPYQELRTSLIELGRACVLRDHRLPEVVNLLWQGIAQYAFHHGGHYLIGCSSLTSRDAADGFAAYDALQDYLVRPDLRTTPKPAFSLPLISQGNAEVKIPRLLRAYLAVGAKICGPPAIDLEFGTIDFLTLMDLHTLPARVRARFCKQLNESS